MNGTAKAEWVDTVWESDHPENTANIKFLIFKNGSPLAGKIDIRGDFIFRARSRQTHQQAFNPNSNGRWVYENLPPGTYNLSITGQNDFEGWEWTEESVEIRANTSPLFEVNVDQ